MGARNAFDRIGYDFARNQRIAHSFMPHRDAVAYADNGKFNGSTAGHAHARFYRFGDFIQIYVSGNNFVFCAAYADKRPVQFFFGISHRPKERAVRSAVASLRYIIAFH